MRIVTPLNQPNLSGAIAEVFACVQDSRLLCKVFNQTTSIVRSRESGGLRERNLAKHFYSDRAEFPLPASEYTLTLTIAIGFILTNLIKSNKQSVFNTRDNLILSYFELFSAIALPIKIWVFALV
ncbi:MAG: hypothetical protein HC903_14695 [Methylacidiphilales bacterium]|nr:hypothetical protein [Candidatus Methylacidiphilales bacterium]